MFDVQKMRKRGGRSFCSTIVCHIQKMNEEVSRFGFRFYEDKEKDRSVEDEDEREHDRSYLSIFVRNYIARCGRFVDINGVHEDEFFSSSAREKVLSTVKRQAHLPQKTKAPTTVKKIRSCTTAQQIVTIMRLVIQRVNHASVSIPNAGVAPQTIGQGVLVLVGISASDTQGDVDFCAKKLLRMKLFPNILDESIQEKHPDRIKQWEFTATDHRLEYLIVSQLTLYAKFKNPRPDFHAAMGPTDAAVLYENFVTAVKKAHGRRRVGGLCWIRCWRI